MKKPLVIILIVLIIVLGVLLIVRKKEATVEAPATEQTADQSTDATGTATAGSRVKGPEEKTIAMGQAGIIAGITIRVNGLAQDSRCPSDVQCIQAGSVGVLTTVSLGKVVTEHQFISNTGPFKFQGYDLELVKVTPVPTSKAKITFADYRLTFRATPTAKGDNI
ncbi:MAG: hypothetical protein V4478_03460 [Patescibacteria group bacterium]